VGPPTARPARRPEWAIGSVTVYPSAACDHFAGLGPALILYTGGETMPHLPRWAKLLAGALVASVVFSTLLLVGLERWMRRGERPSAAAVAWTLQQQQRASSAAELPRLWQLPDFKGHDQDGRPVDDQALRGHAWIADFIYTRCTSAGRIPRFIAARRCKARPPRLCSCLRVRVPSTQA